jgi:DNA-binding NtrC family response regulator
VSKNLHFNILIADRNPHVREFLKREMMATGYRVWLAENGKEVLKWAYHHEPLDLLILDPDLPDTDETFLFEKLEDRIPVLPVVIHSFLPDDANHAAILRGAVFVEKSGNSIERLKKVVLEILQSSNSETV